MYFKLISNWREKISPLNSINFDLLKVETPYSLEQIQSLTKTQLSLENLKIVILNHLKNIFLELKIVKSENIELKEESTKEEFEQVNNHKINEKEPEEEEFEDFEAEEESIKEKVQELEKKSNKKNLKGNKKS